MILNYENKESLLAQWEWELKLLEEVRQSLMNDGFHYNSTLVISVCDQLAVLVTKIKFAKIELGIPEQV